MKTHHRKKGFTIVELVIVIAVIGILSAVLIPTFVHLTNKAGETSDEALVKNLNTQLRLKEQTEGKNKNLTEALEDALDGGYKVENLTPKGGQDILWNQETDEFLRSGDKKGAPNWKLWKITKNASDFAEDYSHYLYGFEPAPGEDGKVHITTGLDVGTYTIDHIFYENPTDSDRVSLIRTNGGELTIGMPETIAKGRIKHFGTISSAIVYTEDHSFHTRGVVSFLDLKAGKAVAEDNGYIVLAKADEGTVVEEDGGTIVIPDDATTNDIPAEVVNQLPGYSVVGEEIAADPVREAKTFYQISSADEFKEFRDAWNNGGINLPKAKLTSDIDISGNDWYPIGNWEFPFNGTFDGGNHKIKGLTAKSVSAEHVGMYSNGDTIGFGETFGLFGIVGDGDITIQNLTLTDVDVDIYNGKNVGAVIGYAPSNSKFYAARPDADNFLPYDKWGSDNTAGSHSLTLTNVVVSGSIKGNTHVGGIVGKAYNGGALTVTDCVNNANIVADTSSAGIVGYVAYSSPVEIDSCENNGNLSAKNNFAGIIHSSNGFELTVSNSSNAGTLTWTGTSYSAAGWNSGSVGTPDTWGFIADARYLNKKTLSGNTNTGKFVFGETELSAYPADESFDYGFADANGHVLTLSLKNHYFSLKINDDITYAGRWAIGTNPANEGSFMMRQNDNWEVIAQVQNVKTAEAFVLTDANSHFGSYNLAFNITGDELDLLRTIIALNGDDGNSGWNQTL